MLSGYARFLDGSQSSSMVSAVLGARDCWSGALDAKTEWQLTITP